MSKKGYLSRSERKRVRFQLYKTCPYCSVCGGLMSLRPEDREDLATLEHIRPRRDGGGDEICNLKLVHKRCNV